MPTTTTDQPTDEHPHTAQVRDAVDGLLGYHGLDIREAAEAMGEPYHWMRERISGRKRSISIDDTVAFAEFFGVPVTTLTEGRDAAIRWAIDHEPGKALQELRTFRAAQRRRMNGGPGLAKRRSSYVDTIEVSGEKAA